MLTSRSPAIGRGTANVYICTSCQIKAHQRQLHSRSSPLSSSGDYGYRLGRTGKELNYDGSENRGFRGSGVGRRTGYHASGQVRRHARTLYTKSSHLQRPAAATTASNPEEDPAGDLAFLDTYHIPERSDGIRAQLRRWNDLHGHESPLRVAEFGYDQNHNGQPPNSLAQLPNDKPLSLLGDDQEGAATGGHYHVHSKEGLDDTIGQDIFLRMGDLVEIYYPMSERESVLAVFVRRLRDTAQCYTMNGRWVHVLENRIPYSIPGWISPELVKPLISHLPDADDLADRDALTHLSKIEDLSIPREIAAPIVSRLVQFHDQSQRIYREHASALDSAYDLLAHPDDLRYGSLASAATSLLKIPSDRLPLPALFTVRKAISAADFGFNIDRTSHRTTGYMQIIPKRQVETISRVRDWVREWQDNIVETMHMSQKQRARHTPKGGVLRIQNYLEKVKTVIRKSRETRLPTEHATIGPSKVQSDTGHSEFGLAFDGADHDISKFIEAWAISGHFLSHPRLASIPPLLLQATGLYTDFELDMTTGFMFLQEIGAYTPFDNRRRFDANLLLPSSNISQPLTRLMTALGAMKDSHGFVDSMADLRHDWKDLPVFCIDGADAKEIDDGISVEEAEMDEDGKRRYWVHVHIANPTAFFDRDHPVAKMARHLSETVYMPEFTVPMIPKWASSRHFSLGKGRPCLTISAKLDDAGNTVERKITSGVVRNVFRLIPKQVDRLLGHSENDQVPMHVLTIGVIPTGEKSPRQYISDGERMKEKEKEDLRILQRLAGKRLDTRKAAGGIFFDIPRPEVRVSENHQSWGLNQRPPNLSHARIIRKDPAIEYRAEEFRNWFAPRAGTTDTLVREMMLLACETCAKWCAERHVPILYRGTTYRPDNGLTPNEFLRQVIVPKVGEHGEIPMHLGLKYMQTFGPSVLSATPIRHDTVGMDHYSKATSPLRRYGDMILHWQIESVLRHEAETGQSLVGRADADHSFLAFSRTALEVIMRGLRPRERTVMLAKRHTERFWFLMLLMRMHYFGEGGGFPYKTLRVMLTTSDTSGSGRNDDDVTGLSLDLNFYVQVRAPPSMGKGALQQGDIWECSISSINMYFLKCIVEPLRLVERPEV